MDDSLLFCNSKLNEGREVKDILDDYCLLLGQSINYKKSVAYFSKGTCPQRCKALARIFNVRRMNEDDRYLGHPLFIKRNKYRSFEALLVKIRNRINSWQPLLLSQVGRNTLIKFVASSVPIYYTSVFQLPSQSIVEIYKMFQKILVG